MDTTAPNLGDHPWMEHNQTGHRAQLPNIPYWRENGWHPCDGPPPEPDLTHDEALKAPSTSAGSSAVTKSADESATPEDGETVG